MIIFNSDKSKEIEKLLEDSIQSGNFEKLTVFLKKETNLFLDPFINFFSHKNIYQILRKIGVQEINEWFEDIEKYNSIILDPRNDSPPESMIPYIFWEQSKENLIKAVRNSKLLGNIPNKGGILFYLGGLSKCIVLKYNIAGDHPIFEIVEIIDNPKSAFDFWGIINSTGLREKNILKEILSTGHKLIFHRNVLMHIDRRKDLDVFGPTIDTILIAEIIAQTVFEKNGMEIKNAVEIGCGNGLISVSLAMNCPGLKNLHSMDIDFNSIVCCHRNLISNLTPTQYKKLNTLLFVGSYDANTVCTKYDLMVCNPPYIPLIDKHFNNFNNRKDYFEAVGGLSLIDDILNSLDKSLSENGRLLILVSSLSLNYTLSKIPEGYEYKLVFDNGYKVIFDVEAVLNNGEWLEFLLRDCGLSMKKRVYYHKLFPIWIFKK